MPEPALDLEALQRLAKELELLPPRPWRAGIGGFAYDAEGSPLIELNEHEGDAHIRDYAVEAVTAFANGLPAILAALERAERVDEALNHLLAAADRAATNDLQRRAPAVAREDGDV